jgi:hypothetical protein
MGCLTVVEDDNDIRAMLVDIIINARFQILEACNPRMTLFLFFGERVSVFLWRT